MEGRSVYLIRERAKHRGEPLPQLPRSLIRERDRQNVPRHDRSVLNQRESPLHLPVFSCCIFLQKGHILLGDPLGHPIAMIGVPKLHHVCNSVDDNGSFAASRPREDQNWPIHRKDRLPLPVVHPFEKVVYELLFDFDISRF